MQRFGQILRLQSGSVARYEELHAAVWPDVLATIHACNMRNYSIFRHNLTLFAYFEYIGADFAADMAKMAEDPKTKEWWAVCMPLQDPVPDRQPGEWWAKMKEVFHTD